MNLISMMMINESDKYDDDYLELFFSVFLSQSFVPLTKDNSFTLGLIGRDEYSFCLGIFKFDFYEYIIHTRVYCDEYH